MDKRFVHWWLPLLVAMLTLASVSEAKCLKTSCKVIVGIDKDHVGDQNQLLGILEALRARAEVGFAFDEESRAVKDPQLWQPSTLAGAHLVLLSGREGLQRLQELPQPSGALVVWSGHQLFEEILSLKRYPDLMLLPEHALPSTESRSLGQKTQLLLLGGVPHRVHAAAVNVAKAAFEKRHGPIVDGPLKPVGIILAGDAPDEQGNQHYFTPTDARTLAAHIVKLEGTDRPYLVTNGPRTGGFDYDKKTQLTENPHRLGQVDAVTSAFVAELARLKVKKVRLYDFQFADLPSAYLPLLGAMLDGGSLHVAGESTSMVSEASDLLGRITIDLVPSMNPSHMTHAERLFSKGNADLLAMDGSLRKATGSRQPSKDPSPAELAADHISKRLGLKAPAKVTTPPPSSSSSTKTTEAP